MWIGHRKEIEKLTFPALALRRSESRNCGLYVVYIQKYGATLLVGAWYTVRIKSAVWKINFCGFPCFLDVEWLMRLQCLGTGLDVSLSSFFTSQRWSRNRSRSRRCGQAVYICYLPAGRSVLGKTVPEVLLKTKGTVFPSTDRPRPANNVFIFFSLWKMTCVDFLQQLFHTVRVGLTFPSSKPVLFTEVFKRRDSVFADFKTE